LLGEIVHLLPLFGAFSGKVHPVCRKENAHSNKFRGDGPGSRNDASSGFSNSGNRGRQQREFSSLPAELQFPGRFCNKPSPRNDRRGTEVPLQPNQDIPVVPGYVNKGDPDV
jgi:hypothetical protein